MTAPTTARGSPTGVALVVHPERRDLLAAIPGGLSFLCESIDTALETRGDGEDEARIAEFVRGDGIDLVIAAGGDGTVSAVARALLERPPGLRPDLAILPLGTANNTARSHGLLSLRTHGTRAFARARSSIECNAHPIDVGRANGIPFVGSFALGLDASVLARRNRLRRRLGPGNDRGGYPLYLASTALESMLHRGMKAEILIDGLAEQSTLYNLLATSSPLYAGEFRFSGTHPSHQGELELHLFESLSQYLPAYFSAWRRHLRHQRGQRVDEASTLRRWRSLEIRLPRALPAQVDGEEAAAAATWRLEVLPGALRLRAPRGDDNAPVILKTKREGDTYPQR